MISSLLITNTINKIFGKRSAETTTSQKHRNLNSRCLLSGKPGIIIYARWSNRKGDLLKEEFWIPNHKHVALYGFVFFSLACGWNNTCHLLWLSCWCAVPSQLPAWASCWGDLGCPSSLRCFFCKDSTPQRWKREHRVSAQIQVPQLKSCLKVARVKTPAHQWE